MLQNPSLTREHSHIQFNSNIFTPLINTHSSTSHLILSRTHSRNVLLGPSYFLCAADKQEVNTQLHHRSHPFTRMKIPLHLSFASLWPSSHFLFRPNITFVHHLSFCFCLLSLALRLLEPSWHSSLEAQSYTEKVTPYSNVSSAQSTLPLHLLVQPEYSLCGVKAKEKNEQKTPSVLNEAHRTTGLSSCMTQRLWRPLNLCLNPNRGERGERCFIELKWHTYLKRIILQTILLNFWK